MNWGEALREGAGLALAAVAIWSVIVERRERRANRGAQEETQVVEKTKDKKTEPSERRGRRTRWGRRLWGARRKRFGRRCFFGRWARLELRRNQAARRRFERGADRVKLWLVATALTSFVFAIWNEINAPKLSVSDLSWVAETPEAGARRTVWVDGVELAFRYCPPGTFAMGSPETEEGRSDYLETRRQVTLTNGFWTLETEVTQAMWNVVWWNQSYFGRFGFGCDVVAGRNTSRFPVENVSWEDCRRLIRALNESAELPEGFVFRLPTEAEWERACRAGTETPYFWGDSLNGDKANCDGAWPSGTEEPGPRRGRTVASGLYAANPWGLVDMNGNVAEWCADWSAPYSSDAATDPTGPKRGRLRALRGGGWAESAADCRAAARSSDLPTARCYFYGFRLAIGRELEKGEK